MPSVRTFQKNDDDVANPMTGWDHEGLRRGAPLAQGLQDQAAAAGGTSGEEGDMN